MREAPSGRALVGLYLAWLLASATIAIVVGILVGELAAAVGVVERNGSSAQVLFGVVWAVSFLAMAALPFLLRRRTTAEADGRR